MVKRNDVRDDPDPSVAGLLDAKLENLRMMRALDHAGVDPTPNPQLQRLLVRLAEYDMMLTAGLVHLEDGAGEEMGFPELLVPLRTAGQAVREALVEAVPRDRRFDVRRALRDVAVVPHEVWSEVDAARAEMKARQASGRPDGDLDAPAGLDDAGVDAMARSVWGGGAPPPMVIGRAQVRRAESKPLPEPDDPLRAWFADLPRSWRRSIARHHDVPAKGRGALADRIAERLQDPAWLRTYVRERLGPAEREMLAGLLVWGSIDLDEDEPDGIRAAVAVDWTWGERPAFTVGGRLRAAGFLRVGTYEGHLCAVPPPPLAEPLYDALEEIDPEMLGEIQTEFDDAVGGYQAQADEFDPLEALFGKSARKP